MSTPSPILLLLGSGSNVGSAVASTFTSQGYRVALVSRRAPPTPNTAQRIHLQGDLFDPSSIPSLFAKVKEHFGGVPSVVVYNAAKVTPNSAANPFSLTLEELEHSLKLNTLSAFAAARQATAGFEQLPGDASRTFIYTGNLLNTTALPTMLDLGVGKTATAHVIESAAKAFAEKGFKYYYADERLEDGSPLYNGVNGDAHAEHFAVLAGHKEQEAWCQTFVKGIGYKKF